MGWPWSRGPLAAKKKPEKASDDAAELLQKTAPEGFSLVPPPRAASIFEFGPVVSVGADTLRGMCAGDNPDAIQACAWSVEPAAERIQGVYRVEF